MVRESKINLELWRNNELRRDSDRREGEQQRRPFNFTIQTILNPRDLTTGLRNINWKNTFARSIWISNGLNKRRLDREGLRQLLRAFVISPYHIGLG